MGGSEEKELFRPSSYQCRSIEKGWTEGDPVTVHSNIAVFSLGLTSLILYRKCRETGGQRPHIYKGTGSISDVHHLCKPGSKNRILRLWNYHVTTVQWIKLFIEYWITSAGVSKCFANFSQTIHSYKMKKTYIHKPWKDLLADQSW